MIAPPPVSDAPIDVDHALNFAFFTGAVLAVLLTLSAVICIQWLRRLTRWIWWLYTPQGRRSTAKHEAGHALVASVLGAEIVGVSVYRRAVDGDLGLSVHRNPLIAADTLEDVWQMLVREIAVCLAGGMAERKWSNIDAVAYSMGASKDLAKVQAMASLARFITHRPDPESEIKKALYDDIQTPNWQRAINDLASALLRSNGAGVTSPVDAKVVDQYMLQLPMVRSLAEARNTTNDPRNTVIP